MYDLEDINGAIAAWEELLKINPDAKAGNGDPIKDFIRHLKEDQTKQGKE